MYTLNDLVAAFIARTTRELGLPPSVVNSVVELVQEADKRHLKLARLVTARSETPGMMRHYFLDVNDLDGRKLLAAGLARDKRKPRGKTEIISHTTLHDIVESVLRQIAKKHADAAMAATKKKARRKRKRN